LKNEDRHSPRPLDSAAGIADHVRTNQEIAMTIMRIATVALAAIVLAAGPALAEEGASEGKWVPLFNGKDLTGWTPKIKGYELGENHADTFRVVDGLLTVSYDKYEGKFNNRFGHLFCNKPFANYRLRVEYRFIGEQYEGGAGWAWRNSGIMIHGQDPKTMRKDQDFPVSIEVQLLGGRDKGERTTFNLCTPGTHVVRDGKLYTPHILNSKSKTYPGDQWVVGEVEVRGNTIKHIMDGQVVLTYTDPQLDPGDGDAKKLIEGGQDKMLRKGSISLQSESHPVQFRKVEIMELAD